MSPQNGSGKENKVAGLGKTKQAQEQNKPRNRIQTRTKESPKRSRQQTSIKLNQAITKETKREQKQKENKANKANTHITNHDRQEKQTQQNGPQSVGPGSRSVSDCANMSDIILAVFPLLQVDAFDKTYLLSDTNPECLRIESASDRW